MMVYIKAIIKTNTILNSVHIHTHTHIYIYIYSIILVSELLCFQMMVID
mgnify:CR=1 FL=1